VNFWVIALLLSSFALQLPAQTAGETAMGFFSREKAIWTSPLRMDRKQVGWLLLAGAGTAGLIAVDREIAEGLPRSKGQLDFGRRFSRVGGSYGLLAISGGVFAAGAIRKDTKLRRVGLASGEAAVHAFVVTYVLKLAGTRERPFLGSGKGNFFSGWDQVKKGDNSFPSGHSMGAWAVASTISHQYRDKKYVPWLAYGVAGAMSFSRMAAERHYVSDVVVGAGLGYLIGRFVSGEYKTRHGWLVPQVSPGVSVGGRSAVLTARWELP
jgi:hypothetical protein